MEIIYLTLSHHFKGQFKAKEDALEWREHAKNARLALIFEHYFTSWT